MGLVIAGFLPFAIHQSIFVQTLQWHLGQSFLYLFLSRAESRALGKKSDEGLETGNPMKMNLLLNNLN